MWIFDLFGSFGTFLNMLQLSKTKKHVDYIRLSADTCLTFYTVYYRLYPVMVQYFLCSIYQFALLCKVCPEFTFMNNVLFERFESREVGTEPMAKELEVCVETEESKQESTEPKQEPTEEPKQESTEPKQEPTEEPKQESTEPKQESTEPKQEPTEQPKQESTEPKQEPTGT